MEAWSLNTLLICFGGGIVGTALGGLFAFIICGLIVLLGCVVVLTGGSDVLLLQYGLGAVFGPHVGGFTAGVIGGTYAAGVKKNHPSEAAKDILSPLIDTSWDVLLVGGLGSVVCHIILQGLVKIPVINMSDCIALTVVIGCMGSRLLFLQEAPWGNSESIKKIGWLKTDNYSISWLGWMSPPDRLIVFSFGVGLFSASLAHSTKGVLDPLAAAGTISAAGAFVVPLIMSWSIAAITLIAVNLGTGAIQKFPAWHCQSILAALAYLHFGSILLGAIVGVLAALLQELMARMFYNHGSNHVDPPACAITTGTLILNIINKLGG
ncbi:MAG: hypothetical protein HGJ94_01000 [Desulfosarcina sp.]|nr:hypothetical protein [Desulfosarcina sp.]MBC2743988.1 hypothetical protein [Desulfosarcina sp.]MBC2766898.1 hypothetical protein [Desulfosarcina sp.]